MGDKSRPIGVFDSGIGGTTVLTALQKELPSENFIYFGDTARVPYGSKSPKTIDLYTRQIVQFLLSKNVKMIVVACNTVSATSIHIIEELTNIPVFEVITPPSEMAAGTTRNLNIGIIGTRRTIESHAYQDYLLKLNPELKLHAIPTPLLVPLVEENILEGRIPLQVIEHYLLPLKGKIDTLILGCTHYPLLKPAFTSFFGADVHIVDSAFAVAQKVARYIHVNHLNGPLKHLGTCEYFVSDPVTDFVRLAPQFTGGSIQNCRVVDLTELYYGK